MCPQICILEYQSPIFFLYRYSDPYQPIQKLQNKHFPAIEKLNYYNNLVALNELHDSVEY